ncbi:hypothetical protein PT285_03815 [Lactobacillus sp. ESL0791]|uniref:hypothetical protein n=1 Tax=Lactobacillus sp. ESL0791 TaxID=2983234 RepID=UPI0023F89EFE|nr:hypothetical protein [Lactobacillus sp. ESL0791]MDF7638536.1 hypothetical protein [Lactobacillus sp. ESL0791]
MEKEQESLTFIGRPFTDSLMNEQRSFAASNAEMENDQNWQNFLKENNLADCRSSLVVFGPDNFMYWYGVVAEMQVVPAGLMKYQLPQARVAQEELSNQSLTYFNEPLNLVLPPFLQKVAATGTKVYENIGDSNTPYVLQTLNLATKKLTQTLYLAVSH